MLDMAGVPQWLKQGIAETQDKEVLHCFLAQIMIDPEDMLLVERSADRTVDVAARGQVMADGFFHCDAGLGSGQADARQPLDNRAEQRGRGGQIECDALGLHVRHFARKTGKIVGCVSRNAAIIDTFDEGFGFGSVEQFERFERSHNLCLKRFTR